MAGSSRTMVRITFTLIVLFNFCCLQIIYSQPDGETLFKANCASCHSSGENKVIGPGLKGIHERRDIDWLIKWTKNSQALIKAGDEYAVKIFNEYNKVVMPPQNLTDEEIIAIYDYVKAEGEKAAAAPVAVTGPATQVQEDKTSPWLLITIVLCLLALYLILNRIKKGLERALLIKEGKPIPVSIPWGQAIKIWIRGHKKLIAVLLLVFFIWGSVKGWYALSSIGIQQGYEPEQPIRFSHKLHAGTNKIDCQYCHSSASKSRHAGIPSADLCMNCHKYIQEGPLYGKDEIAKIYAALDYDPATGNYGPNKKPIQWVKVHNLPDLAYFNHAQHVTVGKIACQTCHGPVEEMNVLYQFSSLTMVWCIDCHRTTEVQIQDNAYYADYAEWLRKKHGPDVKITVDKIGGLECIRCHY
jgi:cytochrome c551/c552